MDKICNKLEPVNLDKTITFSEEPEVLKRSESPVFKCVNTKTNRISESSDYDIPSYQLNQSVKSRTSSKCENEMNDFLLPFSPIFSPVPVSMVQVQPPLIHSLGTVIKNMEKAGTSIKQIKEPCVFESLGMNDKDISWVSSMASPPPKQLPGCEFNTIEKATFFPEEKFRKIQPRALFSPASDNDVGCQPINVDSDNDDEAYKTNIRLSDVCATLKQLEFKPIEPDIENKSIDIICSPVIKMKKIECSKKKAKSILIKSPQNNYEFSVSDISLSKTKDGSAAIEDDSFQSMSFSCLDELCKTITEQTVAKPVSVQKKFYSAKSNDIYQVLSMDGLHSYERALEEGDMAIVRGNKLDKSVADGKIVRLDEMKDSKKDVLKRLHSEVSDAKDECCEKKVKVMNDGWENVKEYLSESQLNVSDEIFRTVENLEKTLASQESKELKLSEVSQEKMKKEEDKFNLCISNCKEEIPEPRTSSDGDLQVAFSTASGTKISVLEKSLTKARELLRDCDEMYRPTGFSTTSGKLIKVSDEAFEKAVTLMSECENETPVMGLSTGTEKQNNLKASGEAFQKTEALIKDCDKSAAAHSVELLKTEFATIVKPERDKLLQGFLMASGKTIKVSTEALEKAKNLVLNCEEFNACEPEQLNWVGEFSTDSGKQIQVSEEFLTNAKGVVKDCDESVKAQSFEICQVTGSINEGASETLRKANPKLDFQGFSSGSGKEIKISDKALKKAKALLEDVHKSIMEEDFQAEESKKVSNMSFESFPSGSGKQIKSSEEALRKSKSLMVDEEETFETEKPRILNSVCFQGFQSASGKQIKVSDESLKKARALMEDCNNKNPSTHKESTDTVKNTNLAEINKQNSPILPLHSEKSFLVTEVLDKAKSTMKCNNTDELASVHIDELMNESFGEIKAVERGKQLEYISNARMNAKVKARTEPVEPIKNEADDWDEIIPSWLHVYNTSPSIASDRLELTAIMSHENGNTSEPQREYMKSPVLGNGDRFYCKKLKRRKLEFTEELASGSSVKSTKKRTLNLPMDFSAPFKRAKFVEVEAVTVDVKAERKRAREQQEKAIKEKEKVKPLKGLLLTRKDVEKRMKWAEAVGSLSPGTHSEETLRNMGVKDEVLRVRIENALDFRFRGENFFGSSCVNNVEGMPTGDGCLVILDDENRFGVEELKRAFLAAPGVQPNLLPSGWIENHYKWIVWKFAHYEKSFPRYFAGRCLTPNNVTLQLKYRYDREIDRNERSALKKILERDDSSIKRMILCVCDIRKVLTGDTSTGYELCLTDGWYSCPAQVDAAMSRLIEEGKVFIGMKLMTQGASLVNCEQGTSPLEIGGNVYLRISTNSTRRVKWDTKLGFQKNPENFPISLSSVLPQGGLISRLDVIIVRVYPVLYMEKTSDGHHVTRNRRLEERAEAEYQRIQEQQMAKVWNEVRSEMRSALEKSISEGKFNGSEQEEELSQLANSWLDPVDLRSVLTENSHFGKEFTDKIERKLKNEKRNVSPFLRVRIVDLRKPDYNKPALLSVWNPNDDLLGLLSEGKVLSLMNISVSNSTRVYKTLQINTNRQTQFRLINRTVKYPARKLTRLTDVSFKACPPFEEVDVAGVVVLIRDVSYGSRLSQVVYLTDLEFHFVGVVFWGCCRDYGWENVLKVRSIVACSNLQWKKTVTFNEVPSLHFSEYSVFTENPRQQYLKEEISRLKEALPKDLDVFLYKCEEELTMKLEESKWVANKSTNISKSYLSNGFETGPTASSTPIKALPIKMSSRACAEPSPIQKRIEKLQSYGEPPPLFVRNRKVKKKS